MTEAAKRLIAQEYDINGEFLIGPNGEKYSRTTDGHFVARAFLSQLAERDEAAVKSPAEQLDADRRAAEEAAAEARLEETHGRTLDGLTEETRRAVAGSFQAATPAYARGDWRTPGNPLRSFLLRRLAERGSV